jgi:hypothetical protein
VLEYILPFLIFVSLGVIIYIIGKHLPEFRKFNQDNKGERAITDEKAIEKFKGIFYKGGVIFKNGFFSVIEIIIKKIKQFLHLIHFWVLKMKKGNNGGDELSRDIEVKKELIESEEHNLEKIVEDDPNKHVEIDIKKDIFINENVAVVSEEIVITEEVEEQPKNKEKDVVVAIKDEDELSEKDDKIESFFSEEVQRVEELEETEKNGKFSLAAVVGIFGKFIKKLKKVEVKNESIEEEGFSQEDPFSDGIVNVTEADYRSNNNDNLIREVVPVTKKEIDIDDEIGVDRSILEKKIVQKIANNPKDMENYRELGELYIKMKSFSDAEECYKQILRVYLRDVDAKRKLEKIKLLKRMG